MGYYLQVGENTGKALWLVEYYQARIISPPLALSPHHGMAVICVTENPGYDEVLYITTHREFDRKKAEVRRNKTWLLMPAETARKLGGVLI